jgi:hypothetical protein
MYCSFGATAHQIVQAAADNRDPDWSTNGAANERKDMKSIKEKKVLLDGKFLKKREYIISNILRSEKLKYLDERDTEKRH